jgi:LPXTG-motif cell wall-anchored protein
VPKPKNQRNTWITGALAAAIGLMTVLVATFAGGTASGTTLGDPQPTPTGTATPTATATATPTAAPSSSTSQPAESTTTAAPASTTSQPVGGVAGTGDSSQQDPETLAYTGQNNTGFILLGLALLVGGGALVFTVRRGQRTEA